MSARSKEPEAVRLCGDEDELFARLNRTLVRAVARRSGAQWALCEEAAQFAWIEMLHRQPDRERALPWLIVVASREALRLARVAARLGRGRPRVARPGQALRGIPSAQAGLGHGLADRDAARLRLPLPS